MIFLTPSIHKLDSIKNLHIFIDTNFLIDAFNSPTAFKQIIEEFKKNDCTLVTCEAVKYEFTCGSKSIENYSKKIEYYKTIIDSTIPVDVTIINNIENLNRVLLKKSRDMSYVDILLLGYLMKYSTTLFLSKDRTDIPLSTFEIVGTMIIESLDHNCTFNLYKFDKTKYRIQLENLLKK